MVREHHYILPIVLSKCIIMANINGNRSLAISDRQAFLYGKWLQNGMVHLLIFLNMNQNTHRSEEKVTADAIFTKATTKVSTTNSSTFDRW